MSDSDAGGGDDGSTSTGTEIEVYDGGSDNLPEPANGMPEGWQELNPGPPPPDRWEGQETPPDRWEGKGNQPDRWDPNDDVTIDVTVTDLDDGTDSIDGPEQGNGKPTTSDSGPASRGGGGGGGGGGGQGRKRWRKPKKDAEGKPTKNEYNLFRGGDRHKTTKILSDNKGIDTSGRKTAGDRRRGRSAAAADRRAGRRSR